VSPESVAVPQPVFAEIAYGIERLPRSRRKEALRARLELLRSQLQRAEWSDAVTSAFGRIKAVLGKRGQRIEDFDAAIAAHAAAVDGAVLVTADVGDMARIPGIRLENWLAP
jgi:tRNA(fMet)-specific endonuclease VapC